MKDYYSILQIKPEATKEEIKAAYRRLAKKYHPDVNGGAPWAEERFKELQEAYSVLSDYCEKAKYDRKYAAYYRQNTNYAQQPSSAANAPRPQASASNRPTPPKQTRESNPQDAAQTKKDFQDYAKDNPRKAQAFSRWMNFDKSSKNSIFDGIKSGKKLRFKFANKGAAWFDILMIFCKLFGITALIVIFPMDGKRQLEQVLGTKFTFNSPPSNEKCEYQIDDASGVTHSATRPIHTYRRVETPERNKEYSPSHNAGASSPADSSARPHSGTSSTTSNISKPHSSFSTRPSPSGSSYSGNSRIVSSELSGTSTAAATQAQAVHQSPAAAERVTDYDCECAEGSAPKDFWITEEDDTTHNSSCARYGEGEGMYSAQGSGTDCPDCAGANCVSQKREVPADKENAQTKTDEPSSASTSPQAPDKLVYWVSLNDGLIHHPSCSQYCNGRGYYSTTPTAKDCPQCGGRRKMY